MSFTTDDLHNINSAIACGELRVKINGREIEYRSINELKTARKLILNELGGKKRADPLKGVQTVLSRGV
ncbi:phage head-tail joining protein [Spartinivicinus ruber]|uniref:phage head-tail joining protein n=1 Tax=Spartinivicinus ruber TaxID=2683272 RepID=UPI0038B4A79E